jgi:hypothetical protein
MVKVQVFILLDDSRSVRRGSVSQLVMLGVQMFKSKYYEEISLFSSFVPSGLGWKERPEVTERRLST